MPSNHRFSQETSINPRDFWWISSRHGEEWSEGGFKGSTNQLLQRCNHEFSCKCSAFIKLWTKIQQNLGPFKKGMKIDGFWAKIFTTSLMLWSWMCISFVSLWLMEFLQLIETSWARRLYKFTLYTSQSETESHHPSTSVWFGSFPVIKFVVCACASARDMVPHKVGNLWPLEKVGSKIHLALLKKLVALPKTNIFPKKKAETQKERIISQPPISRW